MKDPNCPAPVTVQVILISSIVIATVFAMYCLALFTATHVKADITTACEWNSYSLSCTTRSSTPQPITWREVTPEQRKAWQDRCKPNIRIDRYGLERYHYAQPGCEYGP